MAALAFVLVLVGGATRLTESGLSITEWKPVTGVLPPLSAAEWQAAFDLYKRIPQYAALNPDMTPAGFKTIFWWEWSHRLLADREIDFVTALTTSVRSVLANPRPMLAWVVVIGMDLAVSFVTLFVGLIVILPVLGHTTWHLYRRLID